MFSWGENGLIIYWATNMDKNVAFVQLKIFWFDYENLDASLAENLDEPNKTLMGNWDSDKRLNGSFWFNYVYGIIFVFLRVFVFDCFGVVLIKATKDVVIVT